MNDWTQMVKELIGELKGKPCFHITRFLKMLSGGEDGTMAEGLEKLVTQFEKDKILAVAKAQRKYGIGGLALGAVVTGLAAGGTWIYSHGREKKMHEEECQAIIKALRAEVDAAKKAAGEDEELSTLGSVEAIDAEYADVEVL